MSVIFIICYTVKCIRVSFISSLSIWLPFVSYLTVVSRTYNTVLNKSGKNGHPCFVPDLREKTFSLSPLSIMLVVGLS